MLIINGKMEESEAKIILSIEKGLNIISTLNPSDQQPQGLQPPIHSRKMHRISAIITAQKAEFRIKLKQVRNDIEMPLAAAMCRADKPWRSEWWADAGSNSNTLTTKSKCPKEAAT
ncbi:hypothetical protein SDJN03_28497, partial [Cucurbita argyrosperma subsp. sororia]